MTLNKSEYISKFDYLVDQIMWECVVDGLAEDDFQLGEMENMALFVYNPALPFEDTRLTADDAAWLANHSAAIVSNDSQGFVYVEWFTNADDARKQFAAYRVQGEWIEEI